MSSSKERAGREVILEFDPVADAGVGKNCTIWLSGGPVVLIQTFRVLILQDDFSKIQGRAVGPCHLRHLYLEA